jgi:hypothetical protein
MVRKHRQEKVPAAHVARICLAPLSTWRTTLKAIAAGMDVGQVYITSVTLLCSCHVHVIAAVSATYLGSTSYRAREFATMHGPCR